MGARRLHALGSGFSLLVPLRGAAALVTVDLLLEPLKRGKLQARASAAMLLARVSLRAQRGGVCGVRAWHLAVQQVLCQLVVQAHLDHDSAAARRTWSARPCAGAAAQPCSWHPGQGIRSWRRNSVGCGRAHEHHAPVRLGGVHLPGRRRSHPLCDEYGTVQLWWHSRRLQRYRAHVDPGRREPARVREPESLCVYSLAVPALADPLDSLLCA
mmetsp:Transcript_15445/g.49270  ORF Transcript_15445/g.49270 Transcript_15445/m.49270 type:complete len:213 (+) Transcript_15445:509-1147(+)